MKATTKKLYSLVCAAIILVLTVLLTVGSFLPAFSINMARYGASEIFTQGSLTSGLVFDEGGIGLGNALKLVTKYRYVSIINKVQFTETKIRDYNAEIADIEARILENQLNNLEGRNDSTIDALKESRDEVKESRDEVIEELEAFRAQVTEAEWKELDELLKDEGVVNALYAEVGVIGTIMGILEESSGDNFRYNTTYVHVLVVFLGFMFFAIALVVCVVMPIVILVTLIRKILFFVRNFKNLDAEKLEALTPKKVTGPALLPFVFFGITKMLLGGAFSLGIGSVLVLVAVILLALVSTANKIILQEKGNAARIGRSVLTLLSAVLGLLLFVNVVNMDLIPTYITNSDTMVDATSGALYSQFYAERLAAVTDINQIQYVGDYAEDDVKEYISEALTSNAPMVLLCGILGTVCAAILLVCLLERLASKDYKTKTGDRKNYGPQFVLAVLLAVCAVFTTTLGVTTVEDRTTAYTEDCSLKILWNEYEVEGTAVKAAYDASLAAEEAAGKSIESLKEQIKNTSDDNAKALLEVALDNAERTKNLSEQTEEILAKNNSGMNTKMLVLAILILLVEILYQLCPKLVEKLLPEGLKNKLEAVCESNAADEAPTESEATEAEVTDTEATEQETAEAPEGSDSSDQ